jgi:hypothetical protein
MNPVEFLRLRCSDCREQVEIPIADASVSEHEHVLLLFCPGGHTIGVPLKPRHERQLRDAGVRSVADEAADFLAGASI